MTAIEGILKDIQMPRMVRIRQNFPRPVIEDVAAEVRKELSRPEILETIKPGMRIAITAGSRGVANVAIITREIAAVCKERGAHPFVIPAMGSHGGATAEGQLEILRGYNVVEEFVGCPVIASMEVKQIGTFEDDGDPIYIDKNAAEADGIIVAGRVKPHTLFHSSVESGICKMMAIGLAKQIGAAECHKMGPYKLAERVQKYGYGILKNANVLFGLATIENAFEETAKIKSLTREEIPTLEPELLKYAKENMATIKFDECEVLIVDEIGKNISGDGMDPNVAGRWVVNNIDDGLNSLRCVILDIADESHGNGNGIGFGDMTTERAYNKFDRDKTYPNGLTSQILDLSRIPPVFKNDKLAIQAALKTCFGLLDTKKARIIRIKNTMEVGEIEVSETLLDAVKADPSMEILSEPYEFQFDENGNLF